MKVAISVNGRQVEADVEDRLLLAHFVREVAGLTATNIGCDTTSCGACTVLLDGESVKSCTVLAAQADGHEVTTCEGLAGADGRWHAVQQGFHAEHGLQCGFCTPVGERCRDHDASCAGWPSLAAASTARTML